MMPFTPHFEHLKIQLEAIKSATNNFADDNCIGRGGFGKVYKGELVLAKGKTVVAVKRLDRTFGQGNPEFWKEIMMLSLYKHENIVSLLGFCDESDEKILVYEYASRRSLDLYLKSDELTWIRRLNICIGAARGLAYLHNPGTTQQRVLHRDIKSSNVLLEENWNARISDLGLSKYGPANQQYTFLVSNAVGTIGYCDPVYVETGVLTKESDVYSFGVVLFEVLCGRLSFDNNDKLQRLTGLARQCYKQNKINDIVYGDLKNQINPNSLKAFTTIAYQCLKREIRKRPLMTEVIRMLETALKYQLGDGDDNEELSAHEEDVSIGEGTHFLHTRRTNKMSRVGQPAFNVGKFDNDVQEEEADNTNYEEGVSSHFGFIGDDRVPNVDNFDDLYTMKKEAWIRRYGREKGRRLVSSGIRKAKN